MVNIIIILTLIYFIILLIVLTFNDIIRDRERKRTTDELMITFMNTLEEREEQPTKIINKHPSSRKTKPSPDDLLFVLDYMLQNNIIETQTYNQLIAKTMPFL